MFQAVGLWVCVGRSCIKAFPGCLRLEKILTFKGKELGSIKLNRRSLFQYKSHSEAFSYNVKDNHII